MFDFNIILCVQMHCTGDTYNLFAFPSECNFSGLRFNLDLVNTIKEGSYEMPGTSPPLGYINIFGVD